MKQALISPNEPGRNPWTGEVAGIRVAEVCGTTFEVAQPLFWAECAEDVVADYWWYQDGVFTEFVQPEVPPFPVPPTSIEA